MSDEQKQSLRQMSESLAVMADSFGELSNEIRRLSELYRNFADTQDREVGLLAMEQTVILQKYIDANATLFS